MLYVQGNEYRSKTVKVITVSCDRSYALPRLLLHCCLLLTAGVGATLYSTAGLAAEKVILRYGIFQESISVAELSSFAETGDPSPTLAAYMKLANKEPEEIRNALTKEA
jgi:hypothetical protein